MNTPAVRRAAGLLLIIVPLAFTVCFTLLQQLFEYPGILRQPTADILAKFTARGAPLVAVWYALTLTAVAFIPLALLVHRVLAERDTPMLLWLGTAFGLIAGLSQALGFLRWPFLVPHLAQAYLAPGAGEAQRAAASMVFEAFHRYAGIAVGEHLGYLSTSVWTILIAIVMLRTALLPGWLSASGVVLGVGIAAGLPEAAGWELGGTINSLSYLVWALWLIAVGVTLLMARAPAAGSQRAPLQPQPVVL
ncbi:MAG: DUF4386 domain-containing protein [Chloroflexota bacterium]|nr:DUF4386 domain-containing protein [Chloroflexota bacterium]